ncbi:MAG: ATP-binding protein [Candidatus Thermoplasmatota archaeon]|nr:ATP-binding protein [Candidatus Thermoplasmatota archaeon]
MAIDRAVQEKAYAAERYVSWVRFTIIIVNSMVYAFLLPKAGTIPWLAWTIIAVANAYALMVVTLRPYARYSVMRSVYFTSITDAGLILLWIYATGIWSSPFYVLWYASVVAVAFRFSLRETMGVATFYGVAYVAMLALAGQAFVDPAGLVVRTAYIYFTGWLGGLIGQETYQQTRAKLGMADLAEGVGRLTEAMGARAVADRLVDVSVRLTGADRAALYMRRRGQLVSLASQGLSRRYTSYVEENHGDLPGIGVSQGKSYVTVEDLWNAPGLASSGPVFRSEGVRSMAVVPVVAEGQVAGALALYRDEVRPFSEDEIGLARSLASHAAVALDKARLLDELRASEERWRSLVEHAPNIIMMVDRAGTLQYLNRTVAGITEEEALGSRVYDWVPEPYREVMRERIEAVFETGEPGTYETPGPGADGEVAWYAVRVGPIYEGERVVGALLISMDITERRRAEEELRRSNEDLEQFAYVASHDLQEPLRMVASYVQLLERRYRDELDETAQEYIGYAVEGSRRMQALIKDLLAYSRVNANPIEARPVDIGDLIEETRHTVQPILQESQGEIVTQDLPTIHGDAGQLSQLFQNLIANALKFRGDEPPRVEVSAERKDDHWIFSVEDNGIGIREEHAERIFNLFQRLNRRADYDGTGIGLAICRRVVERHGGSIWVEPVGDPQAPSGSRFRFTLPAEGPSEPPRPPTVQDQVAERPAGPGESA